jgi:peptidyl-prolyl cis-trans isomerase A (cyclophilin A)/peptidyl-prolyl cis-trans isomerase B (cyclophilin B)
MKTITTGLALLAALALSAQVRADDKPAQPATPAPAPAKAPEKAPEKPAAKPEETKKDDKKTEAKEQYVYVSMKTSMGEIVIELNQEKAPLSVANFMSYVEKKHYDGTIFHRVISNFMIQGGGFDKDMTQKPTDKGVKNEYKNGLSNKRGTIAMARLGNQPDSGTAQFFINVKDNDFLDQPRDGAGYAVFGKVVSGMDVVDKIKAVPTGQDRKTGMGDVPTTPVIIETVTKIAKPAEKK